MYYAVLNNLYGAFVGLVFNANLTQQYFSYIVAVNFIDGGSRSTKRKPPTCCKSLTNFIT